MLTGALGEIVLDANLTSLIAMGSLLLAGFAAYKANKSDKNDATAELVRAETESRIQLATDMSGAFIRCRKECEGLRTKVGKLERKIEVLEDQLEEALRLNRSVDDP